MFRSTGLSSSKRRTRCLGTPAVVRPGLLTPMLRACVDGTSHRVKTCVDLLNKESDATFCYDTASFRAQERRAVREQARAVPGFCEFICEFICAVQFCVRALTVLSCSSLGQVDAVLERHAWRAGHRRATNHVRPARNVRRRDQPVGASAKPRINSCDRRCLPLALALVSLTPCPLSNAQVTAHMSTIAHCSPSLLRCRRAQPPCWSPLCPSVTSG
jgi:hypothetical protein